MQRLHAPYLLRGLCHVGQVGPVRDARLGFDEDEGLLNVGSMRVCAFGKIFDGIILTFA